MAAAAPIEQNPIKAAMEQVVGDPLSTTAGTTTPISYDDLSGFRSPQQDAISITSSPGTGASTSETWSHEVALENLKRDQLEFQYTQQQNEIANALRQAENLRAIEASQRAGQEFELNKQYQAAQMANMAETQRLQREQSGREAGEFIQKTGHDASYYTSGKYKQDARNFDIKFGGQSDAGAGHPNRAGDLVAQGYLKPHEVGAYNAAYNQQRALTASQNSNPSQQIRAMNTQQSWGGRY
jgi:hypothetical protein